MTPFIDVMLVLLIIFMVAAPLLTSGVAVDLPQAKAGALNVEQKPIAIAIDEKGQVYLMDQPIADAEFLDKLGALAKDGPDARVYVRASKTVPYGRVAADHGRSDHRGLQEGRARHRTRHAMRRRRLERGLGKAGICRLGRDASPRCWRCSCSASPRRPSSTTRPNPIPVDTITQTSSTKSCRARRRQAGARPRAAAAAPASRRRAAAAADPAGAAAGAEARRRRRRRLRRRREPSPAAARRPARAAAARAARRRRRSPRRRRRPRRRSSRKSSRRRPSGRRSRRPRSQAGRRSPSCSPRRRATSRRRPPPDRRRKLRPQGDRQAASARPRRRRDADRRDRARPARPACAAHVAVALGRARCLVQGRLHELLVAAADDARRRDLYPRGACRIQRRRVADGQPVLVNPPSDPAWRPHAESAMRAALKCNPMKVPPQYAPYFEQWRSKTIHFDPRDALG